jgi:hypothetical protein
VSFISQFEDAVVRYAEKYQVDGIVCGHIHTPAVKRIRGLAYYNTGDWVESSTALVERFDGHIELLRWRDVAEKLVGETLLLELERPVNYGYSRIGGRPQFSLGDARGGNGNNGNH